LKIQCISFTLIVIGKKKISENNIVSSIEAAKVVSKGILVEKLITFITQHLNSISWQMLTNVFKISYTLP
jgi:hypothetical protein